MKIIMTNTFKKAVKKLNRNQIPLIEAIITEIQNNPEIGETKIGDLAGVKVHKFYLSHQLVLLAYTNTTQVLTLLSLASHQNFYTNLKKLPKK